MKIWELIAILSKCPAGAEVFGVQIPHEYNSELELVDQDGLEDDPPYVVLHFEQHPDNDQQEPPHAE